MDEVKSFREINEKWYIWEMFCFYTLNDVSDAEYLSRRGSILVESFGSA